jgi:alpha-L-rhamnosidase
MTLTLNKWRKKMIIRDLRINHLVNPIGYALPEISFSWVTESQTAGRQKHARIQISVSERSFEENIVYDSGKRTDISNLSFLPEISLSPETRYFWKVTVWAEDGEMQESKIAFFETGRMNHSWKAKWITADLEKDVHPIFRKTINLQKSVVRGRAYVCGLGIYELLINGKKVGDEYLSPGYHSYDMWLQYQTWDITDYFVPGENVIGAILGNGWYKGRFGYDGFHEDIYGDSMMLICQIELQYEDGTQETIVTDNTWQSAPGPILFSNIYDGEIYDASLERKNWCIATKKPDKEDADKKWFNVTETVPDKCGPLKERLNPPVVIQDKIIPRQIIRTPKDELVLDFGQIITGWVEFDLDIPQGEKIRLQYGEVLQNGWFYNENLRTAKAEYIYISDGTPTHVRPHFTFYGFRYVKIEGIGDQLRKEDFIGCTIMSDLPRIGLIETSNPELNQLFSNALWGQKDNFLDVPTDCPQRDERMGWTGDAQVFSGTACYNLYCAAFYGKYMQDMLLEQKVYHGSVPVTVPMPKIMEEENENGVKNHGVSPWSDAATVIPWNVYLHYGDKSLLKRNYLSMKQWVDYIFTQDELDGGKRLWQTGFHYADWLALDNLANPDSPFGATDPYFVASAYYFYSTMLTAKAAKVLELEEDSIQYEKLQNEIKIEFQKKYFDKNGIKIDTQTAIAVCIMMDLIPKEVRNKVENRLLEKIKNNNMHLDTGFVGTPFLCRALTKIGAHDYACQLILNEDYPSWLYGVKLGATTIWERWNSILPDGSISGTGMNSLNHYAYGSIVEWMYRDLCGLNPCEEMPGFKKVVLRPVTDQRLQYAKAELDSSSGKYLSRWEIHIGYTEYEFVIPFDCEADVILQENCCEIYENGINQTANIRPECLNKEIRFRLNAGKYLIKCVK